jgi:hypothetical protein
MRTLKVDFFELNTISLNETLLGNQKRDGQSVSFLTGSTSY